MAPPTLLTQWARVMMRAFAEAGVRDVVVSPGSRSTPFCAAALRSADLNCHSVLDERSAAFFALGQAKASGRPSLCLCTSGGAAAHYLPAIIECRYSGVPLLLLTADRPFELQYRGAPQTIDQIKLYGANAEFFELGEPKDSAQAFSALRSSIAYGVHLACHGARGPVHFNARAAKPLAPQRVETQADVELAQRVDALLAVPQTVHHVPEAGASLGTLLTACRNASRGMLAVGRLAVTSPDLRDQVRRLAALLDFPVLAEPGSQLLGGSEDLILGQVEALCSHPRADDEPPDLVIELGPPLVSAQYQRWLANLPGGARHTLTYPHFIDPGATAGHVYPCSPEWVVPKLLAGLETLALSPGQRATRRDFAARWQALHRALRSAADERCRDESLPEMVAMRTLVAALPAQSDLWVGNSLPIRELDLAPFPRGREAGVFTLRGANGIDGHIAAASGVQRVRGRPLTLVLGDVSFAHDASSLAVARHAQGPFVIVVLDNGGGRIFDQLPELAEEACNERERAFWRTAPALDVAAMARAYGVAHSAVHSAAELAKAFKQAHAAAGTTLIHASVVSEPLPEVVTRWVRRANPGSVS